MDLVAKVITVDGLRAVLLPAGVELHGDQVFVQQPSPGLVVISSQRTSDWEAFVDLRARLRVPVEPDFPRG